MPLEDFTAYAEVDPNSHLSKTAYHVDHKGYRNEDCHLRCDKGVDHFGDFEHLIDLKPMAKGTTNYGCSYVWMLSVDTVDDFKGLVDASKTAIGLGCWGYGTYPTYICLDEAYGGSRYSSSSINLAFVTQYYLKIVKLGTSLTCYVYTDAARTNLLGSISLTLHADHQCRYIFAGNTYNDGTDTNKWVDVDIDNLDLQEGGAILKEVTDALSLSDALLCNRTFAVTDSVGFVDASLKHWTPQISDSIALSDSILRNKTLQILDLLGLSDTILRGKQFSVSDSISLGELVTVVTEIVMQVTDSVSLSDGVSLTKALLLADQIQLTDNVYVDKILIVSDGMALAEVVEKSVQGVVKTRIFLVMGDLAVQLTG